MERKKSDFETTLGQYGLAWVMARQEEDSEQQKVPFMAARTFSASQSGELRKPDSLKEELSSLWVRLHALVQLRTAPRFPNSC